MMTADLQKEYPPANLQKLGDQVKTFGAMEKVGDPQVTRSGPNTIVVVPVKFAQRSLNLRFIVNGSGIASDEAGQGLRKLQSGKVQQYAAIMFAAVAILAGILVIVAQ